MPTTYVEEQHTDRCFAVYVGGNDDIEGAWDRMFSYDKPRYRVPARRVAVAYARKVARTIGGDVDTSRAYGR